MNKVTFEPVERYVSFSPYVREVKLETIHLESDYHYLKSTQPVDFWKERGT